MKIKFTITLILGLVFQLAQVMPGMAAVQAASQAVSACSCCEGLPSCPCADEGEPDPNPTPTPFQSGTVIKVPAMKATDPRVSMESSFKAPPRMVRAVPVPMEPVAGYQGIRLSVAFCRFVI